MRAIRFIAACLISVCLTIPTSAQTASSAAPSEYLIKAGFTYNFAKLMQWPDRAFAQPDSPIIIGIVGTDPFGNVLRDETFEAWTGTERLQHSVCQRFGNSSPR